MYLRSGVIKMSARRCNGTATERAQAGSGQAFFSDRTQCIRYPTEASCANTLCFRGRAALGMHPPSAPKTDFITPDHIRPKTRLPTHHLLDT